MYPISDLTAFCRRTTGDVPPKLVGASTTVVGSKMYLYGGRLVAERKMVSDIYMFDLDTFKWEKVHQSTDDDVPQARYFHSADTWNNHLIIFGGMAIQPHSDNPEDLCVLNDVRLFDLSTYRWLPPTEHSPNAPLPKARYAHLSSITSNRLFIIGGQDLNNVWLDDVHVYDLVSASWVIRRDYPRHCGTYRSVAVTAKRRVRLPQEEGRYVSQLGQPGTRFNAGKSAALTPDVTQSDALVHLPYSTEPTDDYPCDIFLFSNYNFTDVQRELEVFTPLPGFDFAVSDRSASMTGAFFPPGLRFPTGAILGTHFIIAGTYLSQTFQSFSIWALDLVTMTWSRVDPGSTLSSTSGSWFRSCLWPEANKFLVFGNRHGSLVEDYNRRLLSWDHVICIDLEAFGIYQPPSLALDLPQQELGLAALEEGVLADFEIVCDDGRKIKCNRKLLEDRWPWFKEQRRLFLQTATRSIDNASSIPSPLPQEVRAASDHDEPRPDTRLTPRALHLSEPYPITLAFLQYLYSMALITPLQHAPAVLSQLLLLSSTYDMQHLQSLVKHAMHRALTFATSVGIYGVSTLCNCRSLQIRALRVVMAYSQKRPAAGRSRTDKDGSGGSGRHHDSTNGNSNSHIADKRSAARPRGMSDASYMRGPSEVASGSGATGREYTNGIVDPRPVASEINIALLDQAYKVRTALGYNGPSEKSSATNHNKLPTTSSSSPSIAPKAAQNPSTSPVLEHVDRTLLDLGPPSSFAYRTPTRGRRHSSSLSHTDGGLHHKDKHRSSTSPLVSAEIHDDISALAELVSSIQAPSASVSRAEEPRRRPPAAYNDQPKPSLPIPTITKFPEVLSPSSEDRHDYSDSAHLSPSPSSPTPFNFPRASRSKYLSDTPSLTTTESHSSASLSTPTLSRTSSYQHLTSPPVSPNTPSFISSPNYGEVAIVGLDVIHERQFSEDDATWSVAKTPSPRLAQYAESGIVEISRTEQLDTNELGMRERRGLTRLEIRTSSPDTITGPKSAELLKNSTDTATGGSSPLSQLPSSTISRFLKHVGSSAPRSPPNSPPREAKSAKEEEKRRRRQEAKERRERLALEFAQKAKGADVQSTSGSLEGKRSRNTPVWEEEGGMWHGLAFM